MEYSSLGKKIISEKNPSGIDVRYEDEFDSLQMEMDKLSSPSEIDSFDWNKIVKLGSEILETKSKDLLVAAYFCTALIHTDPENGFDTGSKIITDLIMEFWENLYPGKKRINGRIAAIEWWVERVESAFENGLNLKPEKLPEIIERLKKLNNFLINKEIDVTVNKILKELESQQSRETLGSKIEKKEEKKTEPSEKKEINTEIKTGDDLKKIMPGIFQKLRQSSKVIREEHSENPQSYRWVRFALWEPVTILPPADNKVTKIKSPQKQIFSRLKELFEQEDWLELIQYSESCLNNPQNIFFLDLNMYTAAALEQSGKKYIKAKDAVCFETLNFINRLNGIDAFFFSDKTPFASDETKEWIKTLKNGSDLKNDEFSLKAAKTENTGIQNYIKEAEKI